MQHDPTDSRPILITSIPPRRGDADEARQMNRAGVSMAGAVASFEANGFRVVSVNREGEAAGISGFPTVEIREVPPGGVYPHKYGPNFGQILAEFGDEAGAIVNADIYMAKSNIAAVVREQAGIVLIARRLDVSASARGVVGTYDRGVDGVFFSAGAMAEVAADPDVGAFQMGAPFWDILLPTVASFHCPLGFIAPPFILHEIHPARFNKEEYKELRLRAVNAVVGHARRYRDSRPRAAAYLQGLEDYLGGPFDPSNYRKVKESARYMGFWLARIEAAPTDLVTVDFNDPAIARFISQLFGHTAEALTVAKWLDDREDQGGQSVVGKIHRFAKLILRTRRAQRRVARIRHFFPGEPPSLGSAGTR